MKNIYYKTSEGEIVNLIQKPYRMLWDTSLFDYEWTEVTSGDRIIKMRKSFASDPFTIRVTGSTPEELMQNVENLIGKFDADVYENKKGRFYVGNTYRECFIKACSVPRIFEQKSTELTFIALSDEADWVEWEHLEFEGMGTNINRPISTFASYEVDNNSSSLEIEDNPNNTVNLTWQNLNTNGSMIINLPPFTTIKSISGLTVKNGAPSPLTSSKVTLYYYDGEWVELETKIIKTSPKKFVIDEEHETSQLKIQHTGGVSVFIIKSPKFTITADVTPAPEEMQNDFTINNGRVVVWEDGAKQIQAYEGGAEYIIEDVKRLNIITIDQSTNNELIVYGYKDEEWEELARGTDIMYNGGFETLDKIKVFMPEGTNHFQAFVINGTKKILINNNSYAKSDAIIRIYGPTQNPSITIAGTSYGADVDVEEGYYLEVNTKEKTVKLIEEESGNSENKYSSRNESTFEKIAAGTSEVEWYGQLRVEIELEKGRSQPKWN